MERAIEQNSSDRSGLSTGLGGFIVLLVAGLIATIAFDVWGQIISPSLGFAALAPVPLATQVLQTVFGIESTTAAVALHWITGIVFYAIGYQFIARPVLNKMLPSLPWWLVATVYGVALWIFALYVMAHLVAGNPPFLGFTGITWVALFGHVLFALVLAAIVHLYERKA